jgi:transcriptional regulator with XRE-family HTH domain
MDVYEQLGTRIRNLRNQKKWSQEELAERAELHRTYVSHLENGKRQISVATLCQLAKGFEITPSELLKGIKT